MSIMSDLDAHFSLFFDRTSDRQTARNMNQGMNQGNSRPPDRLDTDTRPDKEQVIAQFCKNAPKKNHRIWSLKQIYDKEERKTKNRKLLLMMKTKGCEEKCDFVEIIMQKPY